MYDNNIRAMIVSLYEYHPSEQTGNLTRRIAHCLEKMEDKIETLEERIKELEWYTNKPHCGGRL